MLLLNLYVHILLSLLLSLPKKHKQTNLFQKRKDIVLDGPHIRPQTKLNQFGAWPLRSLLV